MSEVSIIRNKPGKVKQPFGGPADVVVVTDVPTPGLLDLIGVSKLKAKMVALVSLVAFQPTQEAVIGEKRKSKGVVDRPPTVKEIALGGVDMAEAVIAMAPKVVVYLGKGTAFFGSALLRNIEDATSQVIAHDDPTTEDFDAIIGILKGAQGQVVDLTAEPEEEPEPEPEPEPAPKPKAKKDKPAPPAPKPGKKQVTPPPAPPKVIKPGVKVGKKVGKKG